MWSSVFRGQIQFYFPVALKTFSYLFVEMREFDNLTIGTFFKFFVLFSLPTFSLYYLKKNFKKLDRPKFS